MHSRASLLLLLLLALPGLLLPAGAAWHHCGCGERAPQRPSCCSDVAKHPVATQTVRACCRKAPDAERAPLPVHTDERCGCDWLPLADDRPAPRPPEPLTPPTTEPLALASPFELPALRTFPASRLPNRGAGTTRPPPPDRQRTLPLRL